MMLQVVPAVELSVFSAVVSVLCGSRSGSCEFPETGASWFWMEGRVAVGGGGVVGGGGMECWYGL